MVLFTNIAIITFHRPWSGAPATKAFLVYLSSGNVTDQRFNFFCLTKNDIWPDPLPTILHQTFFSNFDDSHGLTV